ncbi:MAG: hypothetical protein ACXW61_13625 [Gemmatirosa sp.]
MSTAQVPRPAAPEIVPHDPTVVGPTCERSALPPHVRLAITFAVLLALRWALPRLGVSPTLQVLALLATATFLAWRFWWNCGTDRRGPLLLVGTLWVAGLAKILMR